MEKLKKIKLTNQMKWIILVSVMLITFAILAVGRIVDYTKAASAMAKTDNPQNEVPEEVIEQANLVDTSKLSPEELKKLNEEELNSSKNHIDFMIGTSDLEIEAETCKVFPLILLLFLNYCR